MKQLRFLSPRVIVNIDFGYLDDHDAKESGYYKSSHGEDPKCRVASTGQAMLEDRVSINHWDSVGPLADALSSSLSLLMQAHQSQTINSKYEHKPMEIPKVTPSCPKFEVHLRKVGLLIPTP